MKRKQNVSFCSTNNTARKKALGLFLTSALVVSGTFFPSAATQASDSFSQHVLTRVDQVSDGGVVHSYLQDANGDVYQDKTGTTTASFSAIRLKKATPLPATYDLRDYGLETSIKDQGVTGACWAFAATKSVESNSIKQGISTLLNTDYSENHLAWFSYHPSTTSSDPLYRDGMSVNGIGSNPFSSTYSSINSSSASTYTYENGGSALMATFTLARWSGVENEWVTPFTAKTKTQMENMASTMASSGESKRYDSAAHLQQATCFDEYMINGNYYYNDSTAISNMKESILDNGAMDISVYYDSRYIKNTSAGQTYYQTLYSSSTAVKKANHCVTIVGWNDAYSKSNFASTPSGNGAWLIANSYGTSATETGYFWLSYYDQSICDMYNYQVESPNNYDSVYQYDGWGWGDALYGTGSIKGGNVFTATGDQNISAASFYTITDSQKYTIQIYKNLPSDYAKPTAGTLVSEATTSGTAPRNGYHTVTLNTPVSVTAGSRFSVVVTLKGANSSQKCYMAIEGPSDTGSSYSINYGSSVKQSFVYFDNGWFDTGEEFAEGNETYNNVCIKAFAQNSAGSVATGAGITSSTSSSTNVVNLRKTSFSMGKGETKQLTKSFTGATGLSYSSNKPSVVSVSSSGKITAKKAGTATIYISNAISYGKLKITVKKAPASIKIKPAKKKTVKKGKSFTIKKTLSSGSASARITYSSSKPKVASVSSTGKVKALKKGTSIIVVKTFNNKKARLKVHVK